MELPVAIPSTLGTLYYRSCYIALSFALLVRLLGGDHEVAVVVDHHFHLLVAPVAQRYLVTL